MDFQFKPLTSEGIQSALGRAEYFRLLNEPAQAESTCLDILTTDPTNQGALVVLLLALSDQLGLGEAVDHAQIEEILTLIQDDYQRLYLRGVVLECRARAKLKQGLPQASSIAYDLCLQAMKQYNFAEQCRTEGNEDARLRWNACVRFINQHRLKPLSADDSGEQFLE